MAEIRRSLKQPRLWVVTVLTFLVAACYPLILVWQCGWAAARPWLTNDIAFTVFVLWVFPLTVGLLVTVLLPSMWRRASTRMRFTHSALGAVLVIAAGIVVARDIVRKDADGAIVAPEPMHIHGTAGVTTDATLRAPLRKKYAETLDENAFLEKAAQLANWKEYNDARAVASREYAKQHPGFETPWKAFKDGSASWRIKFVLNALVAITTALVFLTLISAVMQRLHNPRSPFNTDPLLLTYCLFCLWFPMRLYTEWYLGFYSLARLDGFPAFWVLLILALIGLVLLVVVVKPDRLTVTLPSITAAIGVVFSGIAWFEPRMLWYVGTIVATFDVWFLLVIAIIFIMPLAAITVVTAHGAAVAQARA